MKQFDPHANPENIIQGEKYRLTLLSGSLFRFQYSESGKFEEQATPLAVNRNFPKVQFTLSTRGEFIYVRTDNLIIKYDGQEPSAYGLQVRVLNSAVVWNYGVYGTEKDLIHNLGGTARTLDMIDGATDIGLGLTSRRGFTVVDDSKSVLIDENGWFKNREHEEIDFYFFGHGRNYQDVLDDFYTLSGSTPLLPRYAFGNWWSRFYKYSEETYLDLMDQFAEHDIPISVAVIDMDWHLTDVDPKYGTGWTGYTWNRELFAEPERFLSELHDRGMKTSLNVHPADGIRAFEEAYPVVAQRMGIDPVTEEQVEFDIADPEFVAAYFEEIHHKLEEQGVDFWWLDWQQGTVSKMEGLDPLWPLNHYHYIDGMKHGERGIIFSRYAGLGSHRYPVGFSGDTYVTWESLDFQPYFTNAATNVGYTWWSHDIGGHYRGYKDGELEARWYQYGTFAPILRLHSSNNDFLHKEPWSYTADIAEVLTASLQERYRLVPYLYTMNFLTAYKNLPIVRPMYYLYPEDVDTYYKDNQYAFGTELIVNPITSEINHETRVAKVSTYIPEGDYFDIYNGRHYTGKKNIDIYRGIESIPVLAKVGGVLPLDNGDEYHNDLRNPKELLLKVFTGADGNFELIEDDGISLDPEIEDLAITSIDFSFNDGHDSTLTIQPGGNLQHIPEQRKFTIELYGVANIDFNVSGAEVLTSSYDEIKHVLRVELAELAREAEVTLEFADSTIVENEHLENIYSLLADMYINYDDKQQIYDVVKSMGLTARTLSTLYSHENLDKKIIDVIAEVYYADQ